MPPGRQIDVYLLPALVEPVELEGKSVVVIDVLRATTTIVHALAAGASEVAPCEEIDDAKKLAKALGAKAVLSGEREGLPIPGFDLGNSPSEYTRERVAGILANVLWLLVELFDCRDRFPGVVGFVERSGDLLEPLPDGGVAALFDPGAGALANRRWTAAIYDCSRARVALWWAYSLPFRMAVYKSGRRYANLKRRIHTWKRRLSGRPAPTTREVPTHQP